MARGATLQQYARVDPCLSQSAGNPRRQVAGSKIQALTTFICALDNLEEKEEPEIGAARCAPARLKRMRVPHTTRFSLGGNSCCGHNGRSRTMRAPSRIAAAPPPAFITQPLHAGASLFSPQAAEQKGQRPRPLRPPQCHQGGVLRGSQLNREGKVDGKGLTISMRRQSSKPVMKCARFGSTPRCH
jgi:hypothetical protein